MINRPGGARLSAEEAARYTDDQRSNLRSWGIGVPEPLPFYPDEEVPMTPLIVRSRDASARWSYETTYRGPK